MSAGQADGGRIVVGVDGSEASRAALAWAVRQAALTGAEVQAVAAWQLPTYYGWAPAGEPDFRQLAAATLDDAIKTISPTEPNVTIRPTVVQDNAAHALLAAADGAQLLVVGSRGHAGFTEAMLGSVGQRCVHHACCPVVVVRS